MEASVPMATSRIDFPHRSVAFGGSLMSITIDMPANEIAAIKKLTHLDNDAEAVLRAAREFLRLSGLRELKGGVRKSGL